jgi:predicted transcriptional regulator
LKKGGKAMRTTIELSDDHRRVLHFLAAQRRLRSYSKLIQEAIDFYIKEKVRRGNDVKPFLKMRETWSKEKAKRSERGW